MTSRRQFHKTALSLTALGALGALRTSDALAQAIDQIKIYYGFPAGSAGDGVARRVGEKLAGSAYTKNTGVVENKPGAGGRIALESLKNSPADGTALALAPWSALAITATSTSCPATWGRASWIRRCTWSWTPATAKPFSASTRTSTPSLPGPWNRRAAPGWGKPRSAPRSATPSRGLKA